ncbi:MAG TPA: YcgN family cysteine cluster protein [Gammaproteobacteria bacterium]|nr:YcgN family cysteine cluster protein [Gammaproteobacteria bacterium]
MSAERFWRHKKLVELTPREWESLCDGCGRCCLKKLQDEATGKVVYTDVACKLLDRERCRCRRYASRHALVPDCIALDAADEHAFDWLPTTCAYRKVASGQDLDWWHPLVSGDSSSVHRAGISVRGRTLAERDVSVDELDARVIRWIKTAPLRRPTARRRT